MPEISKNVTDLFSNFDPDGKLSVLLQDMYDADKFKGTPFKDWVDGLDEAKLKTMTAGQALEQYKGHLESVGKTASVTTKAMSGLKTVGGAVASTLANMGIAFAAGMAINVVVEWVDDYIHRSEKLIETGKEAQTSIKETFDSFSEGKSKIIDLGKSFADSEKDIKSTGDVLDSIANKYIELSKGVNSLTNENKSLSSEDYESYLDISNQLAEQFPSMISGYDAQGNAILNMGNNASVAASNLRELHEAQMLSANVKIGNELQDSYKGVAEQVKIYQGEINTWKNEIEKNKAQSSTVNMSIDDIIGGSIKFDLDTFGKETSKVKKEIKDILKSHGISSEEIYSNDGLSEISTSLVNKDIAKEIKQVMDKYASDVENSLSIDNADLKKKISANELLIKEQWEGMADSIGSFLQTSKSFTDLNETLQNAFIGNIENLNTELIGSEYDGDVKKFLYSEFINPLSELKPEAQEKLAGLLDIDSDAMSLKKYRSTINNTLKDIFPNDKELQESFKDKLGLSKVIEDSEKKISILSEKLGEGVGKLSLSELDQAYELVVNDGFSGTFEELNAEIQKSKHLAATEIDLKANTNFDKISAADDLANAGDDYLQAVKYAKEAKEMFDEGLIGTDDFKTRSAYYSPTGADDAVNFAENYGKISRYMTDDISGVQNFLNDLKNKGYATFETLSDGTQKWSYNISDLESAATNMGMGFEWFMDMFGRLEDYGFSNNFVGSITDGASRISDLSTKLVEAQSELARLEATGADSTAIEQQKAKIEGLKNDINQTQESLSQLVAHSAEKYNQQIEQAKTAIASLKEERDKILSENAYGDNTEQIINLMDEEIQKLADENGIELDAELNIVNKDKISESLNYDPVKIDVDYTDLDSLKEKANESLKSVQELVSIKIDLDSNNLDNIQSQIDAISSAFMNLRNEDGVVDIHAEGAEELMDTLHALYAQKMSVAGDLVLRLPTEQLDGDIASVITKLQEFQQTYYELQELNTLKEAGVDVDITSAQEKINQITSDLQNLPAGQAEVLADLKVNPESTATISSTISAITPEIAVKAGVDSTLVDKYAATEKKGKGTIEWDNNTYLVDNYKSKLQKANGEVVWKNNTDNVKTKFSATGTVSWSNSGSPKIGGNVNGTAHAYGTVRNGNSFINGNWGINKSGSSLVGELGREILVRDGQFTTIGDNGAEFINVRKGDIIFNHKQSEELFKNGYVTSNGGRGHLYGNSFANGSAYAVGAGGGSFFVGGSGSKSYQSSTSKKKTQDTSKTEKAAEKATKATEKVIDWIATLLDRVARQTEIAIDAIDTAIGLANKQTATANAIDKVQSEISTNQSAYSNYIVKAGSLELSDSYTSQIKNGSLNIETITDEDLKKKIEDYKKW